MITNVDDVCESTRVREKYAADREILEIFYNWLQIFVANRTWS